MPVATLIRWMSVKLLLKVAKDPDTYNKLTGEHAGATPIELEKFLDENPFVLKTLLGRKPTTFEEYLKREIK